MILLGVFFITMNWRGMFYRVPILQNTFEKRYQPPEKL